MYVLEFLIYHLYPYGITRDMNQYRALSKVIQTSGNQTLREKWQQEAGLHVSHLCI